MKQPRMIEAPPTPREAHRAAHRDHGDDAVLVEAEGLLSGLFEPDAEHTTMNASRPSLSDEDRTAIDLLDGAVDQLAAVVGSFLTAPVGEAVDGIRYRLNLAAESARQAREEELRAQSATSQARAAASAADAAIEVLGERLARAEAKASHQEAVADAHRYRAMRSDLYVAELEATIRRLSKRPGPILARAEKAADGKAGPPPPPRTVTTTLHPISVTLTHLDSDAFDLLTGWPGGTTSGGGAG